MRAIWAQTLLHARGRLAVAIRNEIIGVAARNRMVGLEVAVWDHVMVVALE